MTIEQFEAVQSLVDEIRKVKRDIRIWTESTGFSTISLKFGERESDWYGVDPKSLPYHIIKTRQLERLNFELNSLEAKLDKI